jgi:resuscitation-promoting factor RpfB
MARYRLSSRRDRQNAAVAVAVGLALAVVAHAGVHSGGSPVPAQAAAVPASAAGNVALGQRLAAAYGWGSGAQWGCLDALWNRESGWQTLATYPGTTTPPSAPASSITTAYGIPQALPAQQMASAGPDWQTNPATQIKWGLAYIAQRYGTPCGAWSHEEADSWY